MTHVSSELQVLTHTASASALDPAIYKNLHSVNLVSLWRILTLLVPTLVTRWLHTSFQNQTSRKIFLAWGYFFWFFIPSHMFLPLFCRSCSIAANYQLQETRTGMNVLPTSLVNKQRTATDDNSTGLWFLAGCHCPEPGFLVKSSWPYFVSLLRSL